MNRNALFPLLQEEAMRPGLKTELLIDPNIESYKSFFDHEWAEKLAKLTDGTPLEEHVFIFLLNWRSTANAQFMPWLMMNSIRSIWQSYLRPQPTFTDKMIKQIVEMVPNMLTEHVSKTVAEKVTKQIRPKVLEALKKGEEAAQADEPSLMKPQNMFQYFLQGQGSEELYFAIFGAQRICYGNIFHEYENFVKRCVGLVKKDPDYRAPNWKTLNKDVEAEFGKPIADYCLKDQPVETGRLIRNCLAHGGGKLSTDDITALPKGSYEEIGGFVRIIPIHNRALFDALKERAMKLAEVTLPHLPK